MPQIKSNLLKLPLDEQEGCAMTKTETAKLFTLLGQFYPNKAPTAELRLAWELALEPYAYEDVRTAAIAYARGNKFFPDLVDITGGLAPAQGSDETPERGARPELDAEIHPAGRSGQRVSLCAGTWHDMAAGRSCAQPAAGGNMSGYRGGCPVCPFYSRDYRDYLNCEGGQLKMPKEALGDYMARYCANPAAWRRCTVARALLLNYERNEKHDEQAEDAELETKLRRYTLFKTRYDDLISRRSAFSAAL